MKKSFPALPAFVWYAPLGFRVPKGVCSALAYSDERFWLRFAAHSGGSGAAPEWLAFDDVLGIPEALTWFALARVLGRPVLLERAVIRVLKGVHSAPDR